MRARGGEGARPRSRPPYLAPSADILAPGLRARQHNDLARDFIALEQDMVRAGDAVAPDQLAELGARRLQIEATEPPILRVLDAMCHNELLTALEGPAGKGIVDNRWAGRSAARSGPAGSLPEAQTAIDPPPLCGQNRQTL